MGCVCSFLAGSFRFMLFIGSLIVLVLAMTIWWQATSANDVYMLLGAQDWTIMAKYMMLDAIYLAAVSTMGLFGTFYNNQTVIRLVSGELAKKGLNRLCIYDHKLISNCLLLPSLD